MPRTLGSLISDDARADPANRQFETRKSRQDRALPLTPISFPCIPSPRCAGRRACPGLDPGRREAPDEGRSSRCAKNAVMDLCRQRDPRSDFHRIVHSIGCCFGAPFGAMKRWWISARADTKTSFRRAHKPKASCAKGASQPPNLRKWCMTLRLCTLHVCALRPCGHGAYSSRIALASVRPSCHPNGVR